MTGLEVRCHNSGPAGDIGGRFPPPLHQELAPAAVIACEETGSVGVEVVDRLVETMTEAMEI